MDTAGDTALLHFAAMEVNLTKRIDTPEGRRYCPAIIAANGRVKPNWVLVNGRPEKHEAGIYYLEWRENGKRKRLSVGGDSDAAHQRQIRKLAELRALSQGLVVKDVEEEADKNHVKVAVHDFLEEVQLTKQDKTWRGYKIALKYFQESCDKTHLEDIQRIDLLRFSAFLRDKKKLAPRTVHNKFACVLTFLEAQGISKLVGKKDRPRFVDQEVEIYEEGELPVLYTRCSLYHRTLYAFLLMTGFREQEAMYVTWADVHVKTNTVDMRWKPQFNWTPKAYKEREVPVPDRLLEVLGVYRKTLPAKRAKAEALIFSTASGKPDTHMIRALKRNAKNAGLNRDGFWLHKFRATFATMHLQAGVDLRTVMTWMGQTNLESVIRYLKPARHQAVREKVNATFAA
jgi:integrase/recombinase XerD